MDTFGSRLHQVRRAAGLTAERLAELLGVHRRSVVGWERDEKCPSVAIVDGLADAQLDWVYVLRGDRKAVFAGHALNWDLLIDINTRLDKLSSERGVVCPPELRKQILKNSYLQLSASDRAQRSPEGIVEEMVDQIPRAA